MSKRGTLELQTPSGWIEIEVGDPSVLEYVPVETYTPSGWAAPRLVDPTDADTPIEIYTQSGWQGIARRVFRMVDSFEDNNLNEYYTFSSAWSTVADATYSSHGDYALHFTAGTGANGAIWSDSGLTNYPHRGDTFRTNHYILSVENGTGVQYGASGDGSDSFPNGYSTRLNFGNNGKLKIVHQNPGGGSGGEYTVASTTVDISGLANELLEIETSFGSQTITSTLFDATGTQIAQVSGDDSDWSGSGFGWVGTIGASLADEQHIYSDFARIIK